MREIAEIKLNCLQNYLKEMANKCKECSYASPLSCSQCCHSSGISQFAAEILEDVIEIRQELEI